MENEERPRDYEAEEAVLCSVLHDNTVIDGLTLEPGDFYNPQHKAIYQGMLTLRAAGKGIDQVTLYDVTLPYQDDIGMMGSKLASLREAAFTAAYVLDYAAIVKAKSTKRKMLDQLPALQAKFLNGANPSQMLEAWSQAGELLKIPEAADRRPDRGKCVLFTRRGNLCPGYSITLPQNGTGRGEPGGSLFLFRRRGSRSRNRPGRVISLNSTHKVNIIHIYQT